VDAGRAALGPARAVVGEPAPPRRRAGHPRRRPLASPRRRRAAIPREPRLLREPLVQPAARPRLAPPPRGPRARRDHLPRARPRPAPRAHALRPRAALWRGRLAALTRRAQPPLHRPRPPAAARGARPRRELRRPRSRDARARARLRPRPRRNPGRHRPPLARASFRAATKVSWFPLRVRDGNDFDVSVGRNAVSKRVRKHEKTPSPIAIVLDRPTVGCLANSLRRGQDVLEKTVSGAACSLVVVGERIEELCLGLLQETRGPTGHAESFSLRLLLRQWRRTSPAQIRSFRA